MTCMEQKWTNAVNREIERNARFINSALSDARNYHFYIGEGFSRKVRNIEWRLKLSSSYARESWRRATQIMEG